MVPFFDGRLEIDNGEAERRLKVLALGRKKWLIAGSDAGAERMATNLTVRGTALVHGVDPLAYLTDILRRIADGIPSSGVAELMPDGSAKQHGQNAHTGQAGIPRLVV
jgi:transposase